MPKRGTGAGPKGGAITDRGWDGSPPGQEGDRWATKPKRDEAASRKRRKEQRRGRRGNR